MTIRLLSTYDGFSPNDIITIDSALEASFIAAGNATANLTGGVVAYRERQPVMIQPAAKKRGSVSLSANRKAIVPLTEGSVLTITPAAGTTGTYQLYDASGATVGGVIPLGTSVRVVGPYEGDFTAEIKNTTGSMAVKVTDGALGSARAAEIPMEQAAPIIAAGSWTGDATVRFQDMPADFDFIVVKAPGQGAVTICKEHWYNNIQKFGNLLFSGSDAANVAPMMRAQGLQLNTLAALNDAGNTIHWAAIKDNGSGIFKTFSYNGYRAGSVGAPDNQGTVSSPWAMDLIAGTNPALLHIERDSLTVGREGVWMLPGGFAKKETAAAPDASLGSLAVDGTLNLLTSIATNENNAGNLGEAHNCFAMYNPGKYWDRITYTGTGAPQQFQVNGTPAFAVVVPRAAQAMEFWTATMGAQSADGEATALHSNRVTAGIGYVSVGTDASVNTLGMVYELIFWYKSAAPEKARPVVRRSGVQINGATTGRISCGTNLAIGPAHSMEWIGSISDATTEQFLMGVIGNGTVGGRGTPVAGSCNVAMSYTRDPVAGLEICTSDQFPSDTSDPANVQKRWRTGIVLNPYDDYHILYTHDGVDKWNLYINGVHIKQRRLPMSVFGINGITPTTGLTMSFGARLAAGSYSASANTRHKFARIYNRVLTKSEAAKMFARHYLRTTQFDISDSATALVEEWKFLEGSGATIAATKSAANNGTLTNGFWVP